MCGAVVFRLSLSVVMNKDLVLNRPNAKSVSTAAQYLLLHTEHIHEYLLLGLSEALPRFLVLERHTPRISGSSVFDDVDPVRGLAFFVVCPPVRRKGKATITISPRL